MAEELDDVLDRIRAQHAAPDLTYLLDMSGQMPGLVCPCQLCRYSIPPGQATCSCLRTWDLSVSITLTQPTSQAIVDAGSLYNPIEASDDDMAIAFP